MNNNDYIALHRCFLKSLKSLGTMAGKTVALLDAYTGYDDDIVVALPSDPFGEQKVMFEDRSVKAEDIVDVEMYGYRTRYYTCLTLKGGEKIEFFLR